MPYTPFLSDLGKGLGQAYGKQQESKLIQSAYMGEPGAMEQLTAVNPQAAQKIQKDKISEKQTALQTQDRERGIEGEKVKAQEALAKVKGPIMEQVAKLPYDQAVAYLEQMKQEHSGLIKAAGVDPASIVISKEQHGQLAEQTKATAEVSEVQSSKILPGGVVISVLKNNDIEVYNPETETRDIIEAAELRGAELQGLRAGERDAAKAAQKVSADAFKTFAETRKNIANIDEGIRLLEVEGANTGVMDKYLPSLKAASIKLDSLQGRLGLDVVGAVTFGALSAGELALAKDVAMPSGLQPKDLVIWFKERKAAQEKLADNLRETALFLGTPGNKIADFIKMKKEEKEKEGGKEKPEEKTKASGQPKAGDIVGGYKFKGGDPSKQENWEQQ